MTVSVDFETRDGWDAWVGDSALALATAVSFLGAVKQSPEGYKYYEQGTGSMYGVSALELVNLGGALLAAGEDVDVYSLWCSNTVPVLLSEVAS